MHLDDRLRDGLEGLDAIEGTPSNRVIDDVLRRGRQSRLGRRIAAGTVAVVAAAAAFVVTPKALDAIRTSGERRPAGPGGGLGVISTVAGSGARGYSGDGGPAVEAAVNYPVDLAFDGQGNLYILELGYGRLGFNVRVRRVDTSGQITTVAGPGAPGEAGELVLGSTYGSTGLAVDVEGNVYVGGGDGPDIDNRVIRIETSGDVATVAGSGRAGYSGDGGPATEAELQNIWDVAVDLEGNLYISENHRIRRVDTRGAITTIVGGRGKGFSGDGGPAVRARTGRVTGVAVDVEGTVYFIDNGNGRIRQIDIDGIITTIAGSGPDRPCFSGDGRSATGAHLCAPEHLAVDIDGNVLIADTYNNRIRRIDTRGVIMTVAGSGQDGFAGDGGPALKAALSLPSGVAVDVDGTIYIADSENDRIRKVNL